MTRIAMPGSIYRGLARLRLEVRAYQALKEEEDGALDVEQACWTLSVEYFSLPSQTAEGEQNVAMRYGHYHQ